MMTVSELVGFEIAPLAPQFFGNAGEEHMERYGIQLIGYDMTKAAAKALFERPTTSLKMLMSLNCTIVSLQVN